MSCDGKGDSCTDAVTRSCNIYILVVVRLTLLLGEQLLLERLKGFPLEQTHDDPKNTLSAGHGAHLSTNGTSPGGHTHYFPFRVELAGHEIRQVFWNL